MVILAVIGAVLVLLVLWDAFETMVLPRRVTRRLRLARLFYRITWRLWSKNIGPHLPASRRETALSYYGPLSLLMLLVLWALLLITGFGLLYLARPHALRTPETAITLESCLYFSGTTFFTLGLGDIQPAAGFARFLVAMEAGMGFGFLAIVISYLPAINQAFSRREVNISLLDARAGSPPTAAGIIIRNTLNGDVLPLTRLFQEWERWTAELLESHLSFPMLAYFRSQHDNQSWLAALTAIMDASAFVISALEGECVRQARLTFAIARHAVVDLALVLYAAPAEPPANRLPPERLAALWSLVRASGLRLKERGPAERQLQDMRALYEPYVHTLAQRFLLPLPPWQSRSAAPDNWQISAWGTAVTRKDHF